MDLVAKGTHPSSRGGWEGDGAKGRLSWGQGRTSRPCLCNLSPARPIANVAGAIFPVKGGERAPLPVCALLDVASPPLLCGSWAEQTNSPLGALGTQGAVAQPSR